MVARRASCARAAGGRSGRGTPCDTVSIAEPRGRDREVGGPRPRPEIRRATQPAVTQGSSAAAGGGPGQKPENMSHQPEFTSPPVAASPAQQSGPVSPGPAPAPGRPDSLPGSSHPFPGPQRIPRWLERGELFLRVLLRMYIGLALCLAPWFPTFWDQNPVFTYFPVLAPYAASGAVRGILSGLGLLNLWIAFRDALRHWDG